MVFYVFVKMTSTPSLATTTSVPELHEKFALEALDIVVVVVYFVFVLVVGIWVSNKHSYYLVDAFIV